MKNRYGNTLVRPLLLAFLFMVCSLSLSAQSNDYMFPASPVAKKFIDFDARGFLINGKRTFLVSAGLEYARIPHQLWHDRLLRLKRDGFNCIEIYTFWNFHEPLEGRFRFSGDQDLNGFLKEVKALGLYAIVRVGPYYCAEWDSGGYPIWLRFKDNVIVRSPNPAFEQYMDRFFDKLLPIVKNNQINKGGPVVLVQLENEHPAAWGTIMPNDYFRHLQQKALAAGLEVPYFFSGLNHGSDPAGDRQSFDDPKRPSPWFTTEFWSVWYNLYGSTQKDADTFGRRTWKIIADGGNGYNYYMAHGGTNFDYSNSHEDAASYDYGAAVGQTGDLRPIYYQFKRNALFARSFEDILENSTNAGSYQDIVSDTALKVNTRHSISGDIVFIDHHWGGNVTVPVKIAGQQAAIKFTLGSGEILPLVHNFRLGGGVTIDWALTRVLGISKQGATTTIVVYGGAGSQGELRLSLLKKLVPVAGSKPVNIKGNKAVIQFSYGRAEPEVYSFRTGGRMIRILAVNTELADRTWFVDHDHKNYVITGPEYISDIDESGGREIKLLTEHFWEQKHIYPTWIFGDGFNKTGTESTLSAKTPDVRFTRGWLAKTASLPAAAGFDDSGWKESTTALEMGADGDITANAWYRVNISIKTPGLYKLNVSKGGGRFIVFVDDKRVADGEISQLQFDLAAGDHKLAMFAAHDGRDKLYGFIGSLQSVDVKGISGDVFLQRGKATYLTDWKMIAANDYKEKTALVIPSFEKAVPYRIGQDPFNQRHGYAWFQCILPANDTRVPRFINFRSIDDKATVFVNGKQVGGVNEWDKPFTVPAGKSASGNPTVVTVFVENRNGSGGIDKPVEVLYDDDVFLSGWKMKGGPGDMLSAAGWEALRAGDQFDRPYFYKNTFTIDNPNPGRHPMWRVTFAGLSHGFIFVNGHNLGGYPERVPVNSLYIPECWLKSGENSIVIYDQYGNRPDNVAIQPETAASRDLQTVSF
ncbi:beta-galactosidase [Mucilaginibacter sp. SMC90]|uniref:beta-galactosidase n=1 Tax=Mucilaginibacter sp. SMC90 TaxID=2929803 RepID=UPI001FB470C1|nr:beta-galactosidase [Mucilaginibacter sp. SMC90]UOE47782.1 beta-galactosidase [Mucilaginibacter sp. SMC90]